MENSNRPVQRVIPIRSELQNHIDSNFNFQSSNNNFDSSCNEGVNQYKIIGGGNELNFGHQNSIIQSSQFVQENVNVMNINLSNNGMHQGMSQDPSNSYSQTSASPKTYLQLADGRYVQIAQNIQPVQHQMPTTILVQMPYNLLDQSGPNANQSIMNKRFLLPSRVEGKSPINQRFVTLGNSMNTCNNLLISNQQIDQGHMKPIDQQSQSDYQRNMHQQSTDVKDHCSTGSDGKLIQHVNVNGSIMTLDKYQEICDVLQAKKLLTKSESNNDTVLVEFRLNQQKYQLRMTRDQKVDMEKLLISAGDQQRQMEILQVYQSEQRKNIQQRTSVVLNQIINKNPPNIGCNPSQIQALNIAKPMYPLNTSVLLTVPQTQFNDRTIIQSQTAVQQPTNVSMQSTVSLQNPTNVTFNSRLPTPQSSIMSVPTIPQESSKPNVKQKRLSKVPINSPQPTSSVNSNPEMKPARSRRYNNMRKILLDDQNSVMQPICRRSFEDLHDVARQLLPYHILEESKEQRFDEVDRILADNFRQLEQRCATLKRIASSITIREVIGHEESEHLLIKRMQLDLEMDVLERERCSVAVSESTVGVVDEGPVIVIEDSPLCSALDEVDDGASGMQSVRSDLSLGNYDIQDISNDSSPDWAKDVLEAEEDDVGAGGGDDDDGGGVCSQDGPRHDEPDLDAAIQSILF